MRSMHTKISANLFLPLFISLAFLVVAPVAHADELSIDGYAWSEHLGWLHFKGPSGYGVYQNSSTGRLSGYAWSPYYGWVTFNSGPSPKYPSNGNDLIGCPSGTCPAQVDIATGAVTGWARSCAAFEDKNKCSGPLDPKAGGWDGWIRLGPGYGLKSVAGCWEGRAWGSENIGSLSFKGTAQDGSPYGVVDSNCRATVTCSPDPVAVVINTNTTLTATPTGFTGTPTYSWIGGGTPLTGSARTFTTQFATAGIKTVSVAAAGGSQNASDTCTVTVTATPQPNLIADPIPSVTVTRGAWKDFSSLITNNGSGPTGKPFYSFFQISTSIDADGNMTGTITDLTPAVTTRALAVGDSQTILKAHKFTSAGTFYMRACADKSSSSDSGTINNEISELDNCGEATLITVTDPSDQPSVSCSPDEVDGVVRENQSVVWTPKFEDFSGTPTYSWTDPNDNKSDPTSGDTLTNSYPDTIPSSVFPTVTATFGSETATQDCSPLTVIPRCGPEGNLTADQSRVNSGATTILRWTDVRTPIGTRCDIEMDTIPGKLPVGEVIAACESDIADGNVETPHLTQTTKFTLVCNAKVVDSVTVVVGSPGFQEF